MVQFYVGLAYVSLYLRHAQSLKDRRQIIKSIKERLVNQGCSVSEVDDGENLKTATVGFSVVGRDPDHVHAIVDAGIRFFVGDFDVLRTQRDFFDYSENLENFDPYTE